MCVRDASSVGSLDTLHATDGQVDTIPGTYRYLYTSSSSTRCMYTTISWMCASMIPMVVSVLPLYLVYAVIHPVLDHWIHYTLQMVRVPYQVYLPHELGTV